MYLLFIPDLTQGSALSVLSYAVAIFFSDTVVAFWVIEQVMGALARLKLPSSYCAFQYHYYALSLPFSHSSLTRIWSESPN